MVFFPDKASAFLRSGDNLDDLGRRASWEEAVSQETWFEPQPGGPLLSSLGQPSVPWACKTRTSEWQPDQPSLVGSSGLKMSGFSGLGLLRHCCLHSELVSTHQATPIASEIRPNLQKPGLGSRTVTAGERKYQYSQILIKLLRSQSTDFLSDPEQFLLKHKVVSGKEPVVPMSSSKASFRCGRSH